MGKTVAGISLAYSQIARGDTISWINTWLKAKLDVWEKFAVITG